MSGDSLNPNDPKVFPQLRTKEKKRRRPLTRGLRSELRTLLENAILDANSVLISSVFSASQLIDGVETLEAPLSVVLSHLQEKGHNVARFKVLSNYAIESIANRTRIFAIESRQNKLFVRLNSHIRMHNVEKTVFVDNLPPLCTVERLRKRASFFGRVVSVRMPQIGRIQRRIAQMIGGIWPAHSGFAFVQFVSKTAAKRFCKRFATNSRLKRIHHHHHGHKHGRKRTTTATVKNGQRKSEEMAEEQMSGGAEVAMENGDDQKNGNGSDFHKILSAPVDPSFFPLAPVNVSSPNTSNNFVPKGRNAEGRFRCNSVAEESVISESGNETDTQMGKQREGDDRAAEGTEEKGKGAEQRRGARRRRSRRRRSVGQNPPATHQQSLTSLFRHIQVFPLRQYRELRMDYLRIKKTRMGILKKQLVGTTRKIGTMEKQRKETEERKKGAEREVKRRRKRRERGVGKLLGKAENAKATEYAKDGSAN